MTARKIKLVNNCINCGVEIFGKSTQKFCNNQTCGVAWRNKNVYRYKYTYSHRNKSTENFMKTLLSKKIKDRENLTIDDLNSLWILQDGKCAISGAKMTAIAGQGVVDTNISIDRIDSSKGYLKDNIQLVCRMVNHMKSNRTSEQLYSWCKAIVENKDSTEKVN